MKTKSTSPLPPWLSRSLLHKIYRWPRLVRQATLTNSLVDWKSYHFCTIRNSIVNDIRNAKRSYFNSTHLSLTSFWTRVRSLRSPIPVLKSSVTAASEQDKAELLNLTFSSFFTEDTHSAPDSTPPTFLPTCPDDIPCTPILIIE